MGHRPLLLDLFCCAGGAAKGYHEAGFDVLGVDVVEQPNYPYPMLVTDAMSLPADFFHYFDAIHASPPCQAYSDLAARNGNGHEHPDLVAAVRTMLKATGKPYVIENVDGAPLRDYVVLCGTMFPGLRVLRHRLFEANFSILVPPHRPHPLCHTLDKRKAHYGQTDEWENFVSVNGGGNCSIEAARDAMGIPWMTKKEINEAIPPAYTHWIGTQLLMEIGEGMPKRESIKSILKAMFVAHKGEVLTSAQLHAAIGSDRTEWARRVRELRTNEGWPIESDKDASDLKPGEYRLAGDPPKEPYRFRGVSQAQRARILERNGYTCQACGAGPGDFTTSGRKIKLVIDHREAFAHGGAEDDKDLRVLCQECNGGMKDWATKPAEWSQLMSRIRQARTDDQLRVLEALERKFRRGRQEGAS